MVSKPVEHTETPQDSEKPVAYRRMLMTTPDVSIKQRDGAWYVRSNQPLEEYPRLLTDRLISGAQAHPDRWLAAQRGVDGSWTGISYQEMLQSALSIGQAIVDRELSADRPIAILSGNGLEHLQLSFGAMFAGVPYSPLSAAYSTASNDYTRLRRALKLLQPGLVFAANNALFSPAIEAAVPAEVEVVTTNVGPTRSTPFAALSGTLPTSVTSMNRILKPETIIKFLLTSGSTGIPKVVPTTHRMLCSNQQMLLQTFPEFSMEPPVLVDWLPWSHTFGGSHNVGIALYNGGTLYIDEGKPNHEQLGTTLKNLREIAPTAYFNVPRGWDMLTRALENDAELRNTFFSRVKMFFFAGAGLSHDAWVRLDRVTEEHCGERIHVVGGLGMTETSPASLFTAGLPGRSGSVGLPAPGCELKLAPYADHFEARYRGPHVMVDYWGMERAEAARSVDDEGYFCSGDALQFIDRERPELGLMFSGRIAEDFKLSSGTYVQVSPLRERLVSLGAPLVLDAVMTGLDQHDIGALIFLRLDECRTLAVLPETASAKEITGSPAIRAFFSGLLTRINQLSTGSATTIARLRLLDDAPSAEAGELTDKGSVNQRAVLKHRARLVETLHDPYADDPAFIYASTLDRSRR